ncbi:hypothetical protein [Thermostaphylospora chromogena]|uniref:hypothetical protein n=1 Tax=Thermostaphylospora chromogena TaxID=35622 RepID=UPI0024186831|nr:hypothetical protein [Thermostaphylospora chromogena]
MLECLWSPIVERATPVHQELAALAKGCLTRPPSRPPLPRVLAHPAAAVRTRRPARRHPRRRTAGGRSGRPHRHAGGGPRRLAPARGAVRGGRAARPRRPGAAGTLNRTTVATGPPGGAHAGGRRATGRHRTGPGMPKRARTPGE